jgi:hypothetical protein
MPTTDPPNDSDAHLDPATAWMIALTRAMERLIARLEALEKAADSNSALLSASLRYGEAAAAALARIAAAEEARTAMMAREEEETVRQRVAREHFLSRVWASDAAKLLIMGVVMAVLNFLGVGALMSGAVPGVATP